MLILSQNKQHRDHCRFCAEERGKEKYLGRWGDKDLGKFGEKERDGERLKKGWRMRTVLDSFQQWWMVISVFGSIFIFYPLNNRIVHKNCLFREYTF